MKKFGGNAFFIDRDNVNTDEIIPAKYLTYIEKEPLKPYLLEDLKLDGYDHEKINWSKYQVIIARANFGSGSSREMAAWAFEVNGINLIIASNFARIFRENCFNNGMLAIELEEDKIQEIFDTFSEDEEVEVFADIGQKKLHFQGQHDSLEEKFEISDFQKDLVLSGGWVELAHENY